MSRSVTAFRSWSLFRLRPCQGEGRALVWDHVRVWGRARGDEGDLLCRRALLFRHLPPCLCLLYRLMVRNVGRVFRSLARPSYLQQQVGQRVLAREWYFLRALSAWP